LGIRVHTSYWGQDKDITNRISLPSTWRGRIRERFFLVMERYYGAIMVDKAITNFGDEGYPLLVSDEEEFIWSAGSPDDVITAEWWIGKSS
jgi:hypothetical protein